MRSATMICCLGLLATGSSLLLKTNGVTKPFRSPRSSCAVANDFDGNGSIRDLSTGYRAEPIPTADDPELRNPVLFSRRSLFRSVACATTTSWCLGAMDASAYAIRRVEPNEQETYALAQQKAKTQKRPLRVLWVGPENLSGVTKGLFPAGIEVVALDLVTPSAKDLAAATDYAQAHGYELKFQQGDATSLQFSDESFDVVVSSMFLCQDFDPKVVVKEIQRVLKPGGRFGFYEHEPNIDQVIVKGVFGERSVLRVDYWPEQSNVISGVVKKV